MQSFETTRAIRRVATALLAVTVCCLLAAAAPAQSDAGDPPAQVLVVKVDGAIGVRTVYMVQSAVREARATGAPRVVLDIDTPGGLLESTREIDALLQTLASDSVAVTAFVRRHALSAGAYIALACRDIYMAPGSTIGAVTPVQMGPTGVQQIADDDVRAKLISAMRKDMRSLVERRGGGGEGLGTIAEAMVDPEMTIFEVTWVDESGIVSFRDDVYGRDRQAGELAQAGAEQSGLDQTGGSCPAEAWAG